MNEVWLLYVVRCKENRKSITYIHTSCLCIYQSLRCFFENTHFQKPQIFLKEFFFAIKNLSGKTQGIFYGTLREFSSTHHITYMAC